MKEEQEQYTLQLFTTSDVKVEKQFDLSSSGGTPNPALSSCQSNQTVNVCNLTVPATPSAGHFQGKVEPLEFQELQPIKQEVTEVTGR